MTVAAVIAIGGYALAGGAALHAQQGERTEIAVFGDMPYINGLPDPLPVLRSYRNVLDDINRAAPDFIVHIGDITNGPYCGDSVFQVRLDEFNSMESPLIFLFGDNEWTDCARGGFDPLERLARLRAMFTAGDGSLGRRKIGLERQSRDSRYAKFRENVRWSRDGVLFVGLHVVGSNNNWGRDSLPSAEYAERNDATLEWVRGSFALATRDRMRGIAFFLQADPGFDRAQIPEQYRKFYTGFDELIATMRDQTIAFGKPVAFVHGDSHYFIIDKPLADTATTRALANFTRAETFGAQNMHWLRMTVDPNDPNLFSFTPMIVPENAK